MPGFDGTGPMGQGPMTGGGFGSCSTADTKNFTNRSYFRIRGKLFTNRNFGRGCGLGRGFKNRFFVERYKSTKVSELDEKQYLENELKYLEEEINSIKNRLKEINSKLNP